MSRRMTSRPVIEVCSDCDGVSRRRFLKTVGGALVAGAAMPLPSLRAAPAGKTAETIVKHLFETLTPEQRKAVHFPFDHKLRSYISNNWDVVDKDMYPIGKFYTSDQQEMIREIFKGVTSEDGYERFQKQMKDDAGGFDKYTCAIFGEPGTGKFEWVLTGRHLTIRADGDSVENTAFGGPIFYGHAVEFNEKPDHPGNVWWHQARLANDIYKSLDGKQREKALLQNDPPDAATTVAFRRDKSEIPGVPGSELTADQKALLEKTMKSMLGMYRASDVDEALACIKENGGLDSLRISYYKEGDLGADGIWDRWRVEGPALVWYFRGSPHVHSWVRVARLDGSPRQKV
ncbi:MAG TPA: DUF3500 domain-containing protein [Planctomycetota bacterium]|nr:DUF3500 domain-containing protein [Planctomycetota bacterium]